MTLKLSTAHHDGSPLSLLGYLHQVAGVHFFVDMLVDTTVRYGGEPPGLTGYEKVSD